MAKNSKKAFVDAVKARGGVRYFDLGGQATTSGSNVSGGLAAGDPLANVPGLNAGHSAASDSAGSVIGGLGSLSQNVAGAFTTQNGYQANLAPTTLMDYTGVTGQAANQALSGYGQNQGNLGNEQALEGQLLSQANGQGPNPAQVALNQQTGVNVANQASLMANQRGGSSNAGLIARQAAQQGAGTQQQAVGQSATLQAQQQLAAQQGAASLQGQIGNQISNQEAASNQLYGVGAGANNTQNANQVSNYGMAQGINANTAQQNANAVNTTQSGLFNGISSIAALFAHGGKVGVADSMSSPEAYAHLNGPHYEGGGAVSWAGQYLNNSPDQSGKFGIGSPGAAASVNINASGNNSQVNAANSQNISTGLSNIGKAYKNGKAQDGGTLQGTGYGGDVGGAAGDYAGSDAGVSSPMGGAMLAAKGGKVKSMVSPGEKILPPDKVGSPDPLKDAVTVPGKASVKGDSLKNDTVPADLPEGSIVLPRHVTQHKNAPQKAADFVRAIQAKQGMKRGKR